MLKQKINGGTVFAFVAEVVPRVFFLFGEIDEDRNKGFLRYLCTKRKEIINVFVVEFLLQDILNET